MEQETKIKVIRKTRDNTEIEERSLGAETFNDVTKAEQKAKEEESHLLVAKQMEENATDSQLIGNVTNAGLEHIKNEMLAAKEQMEVATEIWVEEVSPEPVQVTEVRNTHTLHLEDDEKSLPALVSGNVTPASPSSLSVRSSDITEQAGAEYTIAASHAECLAQREHLSLNYEQQLEQLRASLQQKDNMIALFQRENAILEKEKQAFRKEKEMANKEKESTVIKFAMKEKLLIDAKKEKELIEKQLTESRKEVKNVSLRFQAINEEKSRMTYIMDEKCNELRKYQRECEKLKTDYGHLESKLKYHINKLNMEVEAKQALEKKLEDERNAPSKLEEKANEKLKMECEAQSILLKHDLECKTEMIDNLTRDQHKSHEFVKHLQEQLSKEIIEKTQLGLNLEHLQEEHNLVQNAYSEEMLHSAKLRGQLDELQVLKTQNTLNEEKLSYLNTTVKDLNVLLQDNAQDLQQLHSKEQELLSINKEITESIVVLQNEICLLKAKAQGIEAENELLKKEKIAYDTKQEALQMQLKTEEEQKTEERLLLAKHLSEKTKLYEMIKTKHENMLGDFEATEHKHSTVVKELQRELQKYKRAMANTQPSTLLPANANGNYCNNCHSALNGHVGDQSDVTTEHASQRRPNSRTSTHSGGPNSRRPSESSESETVVSSANTAVTNDLQGPSKKNLVERILRLQQASARQTEKIDFLENHTLSLVAELQKKSKVVQYYMLRDQAHALTSSKSDQNKSELAKYGNGVMSAIYNGIKGDNKSMTLELSLEINKKLQAVLEDTLLKNITLKENLDVLGLEVDNLTRKIRRLEVKN